MASASLAGFSMTGWAANSFRPQLPIPPVRYPPMFGKGLTFNYFLRSKLMAVAFLILGCAFFVQFICLFLPFWFVLQFNIADSTYGSEGLRQLSADVGIFFYTDDDYISLIFLEKLSNRQVVPGLFKVAQVMEALSVAIVFCTCAGAGILAFRKYSSVTGALFLAALGTIGAVGQILMVVFSVISLLSSANDICEPAMMDCQYTNNQAWRNLPFKDQRRRIVLHTTPKMEANWALYIACIGAVLAIVGCILLWLEGLMVCRKVGDIRYQQLRTARDVHEYDKHPTEYIFSPAPRPSYGAPQGGYAPRPTYGAPPQVGFAGEPPRQVYRGPPSTYTESSVQSSAPPFVSRQVDL